MFSSIWLLEQTIGEPCLVSRVLKVGSLKEMCVKIGGLKHSWYETYRQGVYSMKDLSHLKGQINSSRIYALLDVVQVQYTLFVKNRL